MFYRIRQRYRSFCRLKNIYNYYVVLFLINTLSFYFTVNRCFYLFFIIFLLFYFRSQIPLLQVVVKNYAACRQCFTEKKYESSKIKQDSVMLYATCVAAAATILGISCYTFRYKKNVYALNTIQDIQCGKLRKDMKTYTLEEVGKHDNKENHIWVTFGQGVYDITEFVDKHPGGSSKILMAAGGSIDPFWSIFENHNTPEIYLLLESMRIGNISEEDAKSNKNDLYDAYANEPSRHKALVVNNQKPFCAEPSSPILVESFLTPT